MSNTSELNYMDIYTGELLTNDQAWHKFFTEYDGDDPTSILGFWDYFDYVGAPSKADPRYSQKMRTH